MDEFSWTLSHDGVINHNKEELYKMGNTEAQSKPQQLPQEGDVIGVSYDHIQLKFYLNGEEVEYAVTNVKGTVYPALYGKYNLCYIGVPPEMPCSKAFFTTRDFRKNVNKKLLKFLHNTL